MTDVHPTALVHPNAKLADKVTIGPYAVIGEHVSIGSGTRIESHVVIDGWTDIGADNRISPFCSIGQPPQDLRYAGEPTRVVIGDRNIIREYVTVNRGTPGGHGVTTVGDQNFFMAYAHIAHDCRVGSRTVLANAATLAGHVVVGDWVMIGGLVGIHQHVRIGAHAIISGCSGLGQDVPPFLIASGRPATLFGLNLVGLKRRGFNDEQLQAIKKAYQTLFRSTLKRADALKRVSAQWKNQPDVMGMVQFIEQSERGICRATKRGAAAAG